VAVRHPFARPVLPGERSELVVAYKRALSRWHPRLYMWVPESAGGFTTYYGDAMGQAVVTFQHAHGIQATRKIGRATHDAFAASFAAGKMADGKPEPAFDRVCDAILRRAVQAAQVTPEDAARQRIVAAAMYYLQKAYAIGYSQFRPMWLGHPPDIPHAMDCSDSITEYYFAGGAPDPNGRGYDRLGYTGTLLAHGTPTTREKLKLADAVFYGFTMNPRPGFPYGSPTHVAMIVDLNPLTVISHGRPEGPELREYDYRPINPRSPFRTFAVV